MVNVTVLLLLEVYTFTHTTTDLLGLCSFLIYSSDLIAALKDVIIICV